MPLQFRTPIFTEQRSKQEPKDSKNQKSNYEQDAAYKKNGKIDERRNCKH